MLEIDRNSLKNNYMVTYSRLQGKFALVNVSTGHIVKYCDLFRGIYEKIRYLRDSEDIEIHFTDSAIDELQRRGFQDDEIPHVVGGV